MQRPKDLPNRLECSYCRRNYKHGGECKTKSINRNEDGCLFFEADPKGCIRKGCFKIPFPLFTEIPPIGVWQDGWEIYGVESEINIEKIYSIEWDKDKGMLVIRVDAYYYINEFSEEYKKEIEKPKFRIIK